MCLLSNVLRYHKTMVSIISNNDYFKFDILFDTAVTKLVFCRLR